jgi:hypothetical protein
MYAYKSRINITNDRKVNIDLPADMPEGEAELIILSGESNSSKLFLNFNAWLDELMAVLPPVQSGRRINCSRESIYSDRL